MKALILFKDSLREALDRKSLYVLLSISTLIILVCASISFRPLDPREAIQSMTDGFNWVRGPGGKWWTQYEDVTFEVGEVREDHDEDRLRRRFTLSASPPERAHLLIRHWNAVWDKTCVDKEDPIPDASAPTDFDQQKAFIRSRFRNALLSNAGVKPGEGTSWAVEVVGERRSLRGAEEMSLFFGAWKNRFSVNTGFSKQYFSSSEIVFFIQFTIAEFVAGFIGIMVAVIVTAGFIPNMLQKGTIDVLLARPVHRSTLLIYKYLGGCTYVLLNAGYLIGGCWLALSLRTGHWNPYFPLTILTLGFFFAVIYSVSVLMAVLTRSFAASCFVTLGLWGVCTAVGTWHARMVAPSIDPPDPMWASVARFLNLLLPNTADLGRLNVELLAKGNLGGEAASKALENAPPVDTGLVLLTSALFAVVMIALACAKFSKRDY